MQRNIPTANEVDEFFALAEKQQQALFMEKYEFILIFWPNLKLVIYFFFFVLDLFPDYCVMLFIFCRYNFDVVNDVPLPGRYEWVPVLH